MRLFSDKGFSHSHIPFIFECGDMRRKIAVREIKGVFERIEIHCIVHRQCRHDPQTHAAFKCPVYVVDDALHFS